MNGIIDIIHRMLNPHVSTLELVTRSVISLCALAVFSAVFINFVSCSRKTEVKREKKSMVATGSMIGFFFLMYILIHMQIAVLPIPNPALRLILVVIGLTLVVAGCIVNILGRLHLGQNWANQATIYSDQKLVVNGVYALVRHPLYASLIWMFYGASIVYANGAAFAANSFIFIPFMIYRARLEETLLAKEFKDYDEYKRRVGMFFFKPFHGRQSSKGGST